MSALRFAVHAEWTKLWSVRTVWWALLAGVLLMAAGAGQYALYVNNGDLPSGAGLELNSPAGVAVLAVDLTQFALIALAMLLMTSEYSSGTITASCPIRRRASANALSRIHDPQYIPAAPAVWGDTAVWGDD